MSKRNKGMRPSDAEVEQRKQDAIQGNLNRFLEIAAETRTTVRHCPTCGTMALLSAMDMRLWCPRCNEPLDEQVAEGLESN